MTVVVLIILGVVWAIYLGSWLRTRSRTRGSSITTFSNHLAVLERTRTLPSPPSLRSTDEPIVISSSARSGPLRADPLVRSPAVNGVLAGFPRTVADARRRRTRVMTWLALVATAATVPASVVGGPTVAVAFVAWGVLALYLFVMLRSRAIAAERADKVHYLPQPAAPPERSLAALSRIVGQ